MARLRRVLASLAAFAVLATALWPLATSLGYSASGEAMPLCHQAGLQVAADSMPSPDPADPKAPARAHCPLCVLVFFAAFAPQVAPPPYVASVLEVAHDPEPPVLARRFAVALPASRAPPASLPA